MIEMFNKKKYQMFIKGKKSIIIHNIIALKVLVACSLCLGLFNLPQVNATIADLETGARPMGMEAFVAVADDANAGRWNPAGLPLLSGLSGTIICNDLVLDIRHHVVNGAYPLPLLSILDTNIPITIGLNISCLDYGSFEQRSKDKEILGSFTKKDYDTAVVFSCQKKYRGKYRDHTPKYRSLSAGVAFKYIRVSQEIMNIDANRITDADGDLSLDAGLLWNHPIGKLSIGSIGISCRNILQLKVDNNVLANPSCRVGIAYKRHLTRLPLFKELTGAVDFDTNKRFTNKRICIGIESWSKKCRDVKFALRGGTHIDLGMDYYYSFSTGFSIEKQIASKTKGQLRLDYTWRQHEILGDNHFVSLSWLSGAKSPQECYEKGREKSENFDFCRAEYWFLEAERLFFKDKKFIKDEYFTTQNKEFLGNLYEELYRTYEFLREFSKADDAREEAKKYGKIIPKTMIKVR